MSVSENYALLGHRPRGMPAALRWTLGLMIASSSVVLFEPAVCDLLFLPAVVVAGLYGQRLVPQRVPGMLVIGLAILLYANLMSLLFAEDLPLGLSFFAITVYMVGYLFFLAAVVSRYGTDAIRLMFSAFCVAAMVAAVIGILARFHWVPHAEMFYRDETGLRIRSTFKDPNVFAPFLVVAVMITLHRMVDSATMKWYQVGCLVVLGLGILLAFSRGAFVNLAVALTIFAGLNLFVIRQWRINRRLMLSGVVVLTVSVPALSYVLLQTDLLDFLFKRASLQGYDQERFSMHAKALSVALDWPLGIGPGQFTARRFGAATHEVYLRILAENGFLGFLGFLVFLLSWLRLSFAGVCARGPDAGIYAVCLAIVTGILVESLVIDTLHWRHFFFVLSVPVGLYAAGWKKPQSKHEFIEQRAQGH